MTTKTMFRGDLTRPESLSWSLGDLGSRLRRVCREIENATPMNEQTRAAILEVYHIGEELERRSEHND